MDGNVYNYAAGSMWNGYSEGFQPSALELQNHMAPNREYLAREQSKNSFVPAASPYVFFNYADESPHQYHHLPENVSRNQWHFPTWPKMKVIPDSMFQETPKRYSEKQFHKNGDVGMPIVLQTSANQNTSNGESYYSSDVSQHVMIDPQRVYPLLESQELVNISIPVAASTLSSQPMTTSMGSQKSATKKSSGPRKQKTKLKTEDASLSKRMRNEEKWARNIRKKARSKGESYVSVQGKTVPARSVKNVDCSKCKFNCSSIVSEEQRQQLFEEYWELETFKEKVDYIAGCVNEFAPLRPVSGRRAYSRRYTLKVGGKDERVCKEFFVNTFDISESTIVTYMGKKRKGPDAVADLRGKQTPSNKTPESTVRLIREHILSQTGLQGQLTRSPSEDVKNVKRLYQHYQGECEMDRIRPASISVYRKVYSDMHKDHNDTPVAIPPDVLTQSKKSKQQTCVGKEDSFVSSSFKEQNGLSPLESSVSFDASSNSQPSVADMVSSTNATALPETFHDLDLRQYPYHNGDPNLPTNSFCDNKTGSLDTHQAVPYQPAYHHHHHLRQQHISSQQHLEKPLFAAHCQEDQAASSHERGHANNTFPFVWDSNRISSSSVATNYNLSYCPVSYSNQNHIIQPSLSSSSSSLFNYKISSSSTAPLLLESTSNIDLKNKPGQVSHREAPNGKITSEKSSIITTKKRKRNKAKREPKKRTRNEETWDRNVRKRLRFKGEAYISVKGKLVEARNVREVDCSKCKFKCTSRINKQQQQNLNELYWSLDTYKKKIEFLNKYVQTYTPKRKMTGRREYSRKYIFDVDGSDERVCKDFFTATLHISESTIATALKKSRKGPDAVIDMRGKHKPVNKTTEETLQYIRELVIYLTGLRPNRASNNRQSMRYADINHLYQVYRYDSEKKSRKVASLGIFRSILVKEFSIRSSKSKKHENVDDVEKNALLPASQSAAFTSTEPWSVNIPQPCAMTSKATLLSELLPKSVTCGDTTFGDLNIPNL
ncbi:unnamed protein product [Candidula unifasciata]|uniref:Uncharacterized protein n=1 Tax=Candidula unifasciata TaxID=100452 RepID=A0A8S3ZDI9_9EUPU|nr:unnamed protein product [Candidula unifasciata]